MHFKMLSAICLNLDQSKVLSGNGLNNFELSCNFSNQSSSNLNEIEVSVVRIAWLFYRYTIDWIKYGFILC